LTWTDRFLKIRVGQKNSSLAQGTRMEFLREFVFADNR